MSTAVAPPKKSPTRKLPRTKVAETPPVPRPTHYPGYLTDEWYAYLTDMFRRMTPEEVRADLIKFGINDKHGQLTAPYRS